MLVWEDFITGEPSAMLCPYSNVVMVIVDVDYYIRHTE